MGSYHPLADVLIGLEFQDLMGLHHLLIQCSRIRAGCFVPPLVHRVSHKLQGIFLKCPSKDSVCDYLRENLFALKIGAFLYVDIHFFYQLLPLLLDDLLALLLLLLKHIDLLEFLLDLCGIVDSLLFFEEVEGPPFEVLVVLPNPLLLFRVVVWRLLFLRFHG